MEDKKTLQALIDDSEGALLQTILDRQEGTLGLSDPGGPQPEANTLAHWEDELDKLTRPPRRHPRRRVLMVAAILAGLLLVSVAAYAAHHLGLFISHQKEFTQFSTTRGPEHLVQSWANVPVPTHSTDGFFISDAIEGGGMYMVEYANSQGLRYTIYLYTDSSVSRVDTENAANLAEFSVGDSVASLVEKGDLTTLSWNLSPYIASIEFCPEDTTLDEIVAVAESMAPPAITEEKRE